MVNRIYIKEYVPRSWFHPKGIYKVLKRFEHRLPDVSGCLFATFTIDREAMRSLGYGPSGAFDITRDRIRKMFHKLSKGFKWQGKLYRIEAEYCTKVEFHTDEEGWPHFHVIWLTRRFVPAEMLTALWRHGRVNVKRIRNEDFNYLLKYVCKSGRIPEWVQDRKRLRIFQPSRHFLKPEEIKEKKENLDTGKIPRRSSTIRERLKKWERLALLVTENCETAKKTFRELPLWNTFQIIFDHLVYATALDGRYLGSGKIMIRNKTHLDKWTKRIKQNLPLLQQVRMVSSCEG